MGGGAGLDGAGAGGGLFCATLVAVAVGGEVAGVPFPGVEVASGFGVAVAVGDGVAVADAVGVVGSVVSVGFVATGVVADPTQIRPACQMPSESTVPCARTNTPLDGTSPVTSVALLTRIANPWISQNSPFIC